MIFSITTIPNQYDKLDTAVVWGHVREKERVQHFHNTSDYLQMVRVQFEEIVTKYQADGVINVKIEEIHLTPEVGNDIYFVCYGDVIRMKG